MVMSARARLEPRPLPILVLLSGLFTLLLVGSLVVPAGASGTATTYLAGGRSSAGAVIRPRRVVLSGDSTLWLTRAHWSSWRHGQAVGVARTHWNNCKPNCASGTITVVPARIILYRTRHRCGRWFYTRVRFHFTASRPPGVRQGYRWNAAPACT
jgi:hypothetical protein